MFPDFEWSYFRSLLYLTEVFCLPPYSGDLNSKLGWYSDNGNWFENQIIHFSDAQWYLEDHLVNGPLSRPPFEYHFAVLMPGTMVQCICIAKQWKTNKLKFAIQIATVQII